MGEKARMVAMPRGTGSYAIHIIMERATAKSNDCYVEFESQVDAENEAYRLQTTKRLIGNRRARIAMSSQEELMSEILPRAKCVRWQSCKPEVIQNTDEYLDGFQGFVTSEEMHHTSRIAMTPTRVSSQPHLSYDQRSPANLLTLKSCSINSLIGTRSAHTNQ